MGNGVRFVRIRGKIVPIRERAKQGVALAAGGAAGGLVGTVYGNGMAIQEASADLRNMNARFARDIAKNPSKEVDVAAFLKKIKSDVRPITELSEIPKGLKPKDTEALKNTLFQSWQTGNAFYAPKGVVGTEAAHIISRSDTHKALLGHELGHHADFMKNGTPTGLANPFKRLWMRVSGAEFDMERRAWKMSPTRDFTGASDALRTYARARNYSRIGLGIGAAVGIGAAAWYLYGRNKKNVR